MILKKTVFIFAALIFLSQCSSQPPEFSETEWHEKVLAEDSELLYTAHVDSKGVFFNPWLERERPHRSGSWFFFKREKFEEVPEEKFGSVPNYYNYLLDKSFNSISYAGHASIIVKLDGETIFTDPFFSNAAVVVQKKEKIKFDYSKVPEKPVVLISHNHYDHLDKKSIKRLAEKDAVFIAPLGLKDLMLKYGAREIHELDWWESVTIGEIKYTFLPAQHWSRRIGQRGGSTLWGGFLIQGSKNIYFSGDTGYFIGFKEFGNLFNIDYAVLGSGAYEPRWFMHYSHMNIQEFFMAAEDLKAKSVIPMHFGIIKLSDEPVLYPLFEITNTIKLNPGFAKTVHPLRVGEFLKIQ